MHDNNLDSLSIINDENKDNTNDQGSDELSVVEDYLLVNSIDSIKEGIIIFDGELAEGGLLQEVNVDKEKLIIDASTLVQNCDANNNLIAIILMITPLNSWEQKVQLK